MASEMPGTVDFRENAASEEGSEAEETDAQVESALFDEDEGGATEEDDEEGWGEESLFDDADEEESEGGADAEKGEAKEASGVKKLEKRLQKVTKERRELRSELAKAKERLQAMEKELKPFEPFKDRDPEVMAFDASFMDAFERLAKEGHSDLISVAKKVNQYRGSGRAPSPEKTEGRMESAKPEAGKTESASVEKVLRKTARKEAEDVLRAQKLKTGFRKAIADHIVKSGEYDLADLSEKDIMAAARDWIQGHGFKAADVLEGAPKKEAASKPSTGRKQGRAALSQATRKAEGEREKGDQPKTRDEWEARKNERLRDLELSMTA